MPVYAYLCDSCGAEIEILHAISATRTTCGLACRRRDSGPFGKGSIQRKITAAHVQARRSAPVTGSSGGSMRERALERLGGDTLSEREIAKAKKGGLTVYRREGDGTYQRDGGDASLPAQIKKPESP